MSIQTVDIRPGVSVLSVLKHLNYRPWFAIAEFVDNAIQSFTASRERLVAIHGSRARLRVTIELQDNPSPRLVIRDNAAGIGAADYPRAFRPAAVPPDRTGLSEFGIGMKSAACWFAPRWRVRTKALGESVQRTIVFDINRIVRDDITELSIEETPARPDEHFTEVVLEDLHRRPTGRTLGKIKEHLTDIYRVFTRDGLLELHFDGRPLHYEPPAILKAPYYRSPDEPPRQWRKDIEFDFGEGLRVHGFAAIRATGSTSHAGFALFRRSRLIQGSGDEGYRPDTIFGNSNSYRYQRLFGELHLQGFEVSHTKDGIRWDENEQPFLDILREHLDREPGVSSPRARKPPEPTPLPSPTLPLSPLLFPPSSPPFPLFPPFSSFYPPPSLSPSPPSPPPPPSPPSPLPLLLLPHPPPSLQRLPSRLSLSCQP